MKKNGFALLELLLVVYVIALLASLLLPKILKHSPETIKEEKDNANNQVFFSEARILVTSAKDEYLLKSFSDSNNRVFAHINGNDCNNALANIRDEIDYYIEFNIEGNISKYYVTDHNYMYSYISENFGDNFDSSKILDSDFVLYNENINKFNITCDSFERID